MSGNRFWGQDQGCLIVNNNAVRLHRERCVIRQPVLQEQCRHDRHRCLEFEHHQGQRQYDQRRILWRSVRRQHAQDGYRPCRPARDSAQKSRRTPSGADRTIPSTSEMRDARIATDNTECDLIAIGARHPRRQQTAVLSQNNRVTHRSATTLARQEEWPVGRCRKRSTCCLLARIRQPGHRDPPTRQPEAHEKGRRSRGALSGDSIWLWGLKFEPRLAESESRSPTARRSPKFIGKTGLRPFCGSPSLRRRMCSGLPGLP